MKILLGIILLFCWGAFFYCTYLYINHQTEQKTIVIHDTIFITVNSNKADTCGIIIINKK